MKEWVKSFFPQYSEKPSEVTNLACYFKRIPSNEIQELSNTLKVLMENHKQTNFSLLVSELTQESNYEQRAKLIKNLRTLTCEQLNDDLSYTLIELRQVPKTQRKDFIGQVLTLIKTLPHPLEKEGLGTIMWLLREIFFPQRGEVVHSIVTQTQHRDKTMHYEFSDLVRMLQTRGESDYFAKRTAYFRRHAKFRH